jgi:uncharacterized protein (TIGR02145 family)
VKVGENPTNIEPSAALEIESTTQGLLPPRMTEAQMNAIVSPAEGLLVFCTDCMPKGPYTFDATAWLPLSGSSADTGSNGTSEVSSYSGAGCAGGPGSISGTMTVGVAVSGVTMTLYADVTQAGTWSLTAIQNGVTFSGNGTFAATGCQQITLTGSGTPLESGSFTWTTNTAPSGSAIAEVAPEPSAGGSAVVASYGDAGCSGGTGSISGAMTQGIAVSGVTMELYANVTQPGTWSLEATENGVTFSGSGTFAATGCQLITLTGSGTPAALGTYTWTTNTTPAGSAEATVGDNPVNVPSGLGSGTFTGLTCFDIALSNNDVNHCGALSARQSQQADFTDPATHTQSYTFTPSGTVSNVRFAYVNTNGTVITGISGDNTGDNISTPVVATVNYSTTLNTDALGRTSVNPLTADIYVIYNDGAINNGTDQQLKLTTQVKDCRCDCGAFVAPGVYREFLCYNLGASTSIDPHTASIGLNGAYVQWGRRGPTGDSRITWQTSPNTPNFRASPTPTDPNAGNAGSTWESSLAGNTAWNGTSKTSNDPCPSGYRVPTRDEWQGVIDHNTVTRTGTWSTITGDHTNYGAALHFGILDGLTYRVSLTLPATGTRSTLGGLANRGRKGWYWSSNSSAYAGYGGKLFYENAWALDFGVNYVITTNDKNRTTRTGGMSIRCIKQ